MIKSFIALLIYLVALGVMLLPVYWAIAVNPVYLLLILVSWIPAGIIGKLAEGISEL